jgi:hypothetical protein
MPVVNGTGETTAYLVLASLLRKNSSQSEGGEGTPKDRQKGVGAGFDQCRDEAERREFHIIATVDSWDQATGRSDLKWTTFGFRLYCEYMSMQQHRL